MIPRPSTGSPQYGRLLCFAPTIAPRQGQHPPTRTLARGCELPMCPGRLPRQPPGPVAGVLRDAGQRRSEHRTGRVRGTGVEGAAHGRHQLPRDIKAGAGVRGHLLGVRRTVIQVLRWGLGVRPRPRPPVERLDRHPTVLGRGADFDSSGASGAAGGCDARRPWRSRGLHPPTGARGALPATSWSRARRGGH